MDCGTEFCRLHRREQLKAIFKNTYGRLPKDDEELATFEEYLRSVGKWK